MCGEHRSEMCDFPSGPHWLHLAGPLRSVETYDLISRIDDLDLPRGAMLVVDLAAVTDVDLSGLAALRELCEVALEGGHPVELELGKHAGTPLGDAFEAMIAEARHRPEA